MCVVAGLLPVPAHADFPFEIEGRQFTVENDVLTSGNRDRACNQHNTLGMSPRDPLGWDSQLHGRLGWRPSALANIRTALNREIGPVRVALARELGVTLE